MGDVAVHSAHLYQSLLLDGGSSLPPALPQVQRHAPQTQSRPAARTRVSSAASSASSRLSGTSAASSTLPRHARAPATPPLEPDATAVSAWHLPEPTGPAPSPRAFHSATVIGTLVYVFGGRSGGSGSALADVYVLDTVALAWSKAVTHGEGPSPRFKHETVAHGRRLLVIGGENGRRRFADIFMLDTDSMQWSRVPAELPRPLGAFGAVVVGNTLHVMGKKGPNESTTDLFSLSLTRCEWLDTSSVGGTLPLARSGHSLASIGGRLFLFGGRSDSHDVDVVAYHAAERAFRTYTYRKGTAPPNRSFHSCVAVGHRLVVFGGLRSGTVETLTGFAELGDLYVLNTKSMTWMQPAMSNAPPIARYGHASAAVGPYLFVIGGMGVESVPEHSLIVLNMLGIDNAASPQWTDYSSIRPNIFVSMDEMRTTLAGNDPRLDDEGRKKRRGRVSRR